MNKNTFQAVTVPIMIAMINCSADITNTRSEQL